MYKLLLTFKSALEQFYISNQMQHFSYNASVVQSAVADPFTKYGACIKAFKVESGNKLY